MKYFLGFLGVVVLVVFVFVLVVRGFSHHSSNPPKNQSQLSDYTNTSTIMRLSIEGPVAADQSYSEVQVTIGRDANTIEVIKGYQGQVLKSKTFPNNSDAYGNFLRALQLLNYTKGTETPGLADERGYCPDGNRYVYEIVSGAAEVQRYWIGSCGVGTFKGNSAEIRKLFIRQIPGYASFVSNLNINY
ncbi:MAG TPA: hypothetical protein VLH38_04195 [Patescibacteria group bacterium]|nr:hypothetical protein [Patescibacteria group bacterium]